MRPKAGGGDDADDLFRARLENIIDMKNPLVRLAHRVDWIGLDAAYGAHYAEAGRPGVPTRMMVGLHILKHVHDLSDEAVCERWVYDPYFQYFCGEVYFQHVFPHDRSSMTRWRQRIGADALTTLLQESLSVAHTSGALKPEHCRRVTVDTTVQEKAIAFPTDAKLVYGSIVRLAALARRHGVKLRQSYIRVAKQALIMHGRYAHAKQFRRRNARLRFLNKRLGRIIRDIRRKIGGDDRLEEAFAMPLQQAEAVIRQQSRKRGQKIYALHAPEVECIGKGKAHKPYEFGCKVSIATTNARSPGGMFVLHAKAFHGNPYDGHTLGTVVRELERITGIEPERIYVDKGYKGHDAPNPFRVYRSGQKRGVFGQIKRELKRRSAIEAVIGHMKTDGRLGRNFLKGREGDRINAILAAVGHNFRLLINWFRLLLCFILTAMFQQPRTADARS